MTLRLQLNSHKLHLTQAAGGVEAGSGIVPTQQAAEQCADAPEQPRARIHRPQPQLWRGGNAPEPSSTEA